MPMMHSWRCLTLIVCVTLTVIGALAATDTDAAKATSDAESSTDADELAQARGRPKAGADHAAQAGRDHRGDRARRQVSARRSAAGRLLGQSRKNQGAQHLRSAAGAHDAFRTGRHVAGASWRSSKPSHVCRRTSGRPCTRRSIAARTGSTSISAKLRRATPDALYNVWGHAYSIQALVQLHERAAGDTERQAKLKELAADAGRYAGPLQLRRRRLVVLRFGRRHADARRRGLQLLHGHRPHRAERSRSRSASNFPSGSRRRRSPRSSASRSPTSATPTASTCGWCRCT